MNIKFIFDMLDSHLIGYHNQLNDVALTLTKSKIKAKIEALELFRKSLKQFMESLK